MCLISKNKVKIAEEDMTVYKTGNTSAFSFKSGYMNYSYTFNLLYKTTIRETTDFCASCIKEINGLTEESGYRLEGDEYSLAKLKLIALGYKAYGEGFHCTLQPEPHISNGNHNVIECVIPKGSEYIEGVKGFLISNQIIIIKPINS